MHLLRLTVVWVANSSVYNSLLVMIPAVTVCSVHEDQVKFSIGNVNEINNVKCFQFWNFGKFTWCGHNIKKYYVILYEWLTLFLCSV